MNHKKFYNLQSYTDASLYRCKRSRSINDHRGWFEDFFLNPLFSDLTFYVGEWPQYKTGQPMDKSKLLRVPAHRCVISGVNSTFDDLVGDQDEVIISNMKPLDFLLILRYIYTEKCTFAKGHVSIFCWSFRLDMIGLFRNVAYQLKESVLYSCKVNMPLLNETLSDVFGSFHHLQPKMTNEFVQNLRFIIASNPVFMLQNGVQISRDALAFVLNLKLDWKETILLELCLKWARNQLTQHSPPAELTIDRQLRQTIGDLLFKIRLPLLTREQLNSSSLFNGEILTQEEKNNLIAFASKEGAVRKTGGDEFVDRFDHQWRFDQKISSKFCLSKHKTAYGPCWSPHKKETGVITSSGLISEQLFFETNVDTFLIGFSLSNMSFYEHSLLQSVQLINTLNGQQLYYERNRKMVNYDRYEDFTTIHLKEPIRILGRQRYRLCGAYDKETNTFLAPGFEETLSQEDTCLQVKVDCPSYSELIFVQLIFAQI